jgi:hypothetical protein
MKHKKLSLVFSLMLCLGATALYAQQDADAAGGDASGSGGSASYSIGQVVYTYVTGTSGSSNQGVQQPYEFFFPAGINENKNISLSMTVFPNPTQTIVNLKIESQSFENFIFHLYDAVGQNITEQAINGPLTVIPMQGLAAGTYMLEVTNGGKTLKTFTIIKYN